MAPRVHPRAEHAAGANELPIVLHHLLEQLRLHDERRAARDVLPLLAVIRHHIGRERFEHPRLLRR